MIEENKIIIYTGEDKKVHLDVTFRDESLWLTQIQIAALFETERSVITKHLQNIFRSGELSEKSNVQKMHIASSDKPLKLYGLNAIISVGYRVNSKQATQFRIWATRVLRDYIFKGYTLNARRLKESQSVKLKELEKTVSILQGVIRARSLSESEARGLLSVIADYANSWILLQQYDAGRLETKKRIIRGIAYIDSEEGVNAILSLKNHLQKKGEGSDVFGVSRHKDAIGGVLESIRQSFGGKDLYPSLEEKAAHLLYFIIKQHLFVDGNKRIASLLFIFFLSKNEYLQKKTGERKINDNALVALALLIAESKPGEKDVMVSLVTNLLSAS